MQIPARIKSLSERIANLIKNEGATEGEVQSAIDRLKHLCEKYDMNFDDLMSDEEKKESVVFKIRRGDFIAQKITFQTIGSVVGYTEPIYTNRIKNIGWFYELKCTKAEEIEIRAKSEFFIKKAKQDVDLFLSAFCHKNNLLFPHNEEEEITEEEKRERERRALKVELMQRGMDRHRFLKQLNE